MAPVVNLHGSTGALLLKEDNMATPKKNESDKVEAPATLGAPVEPDVFGQAEEGTSLTDRQRTRLEKRDAAVAEPLAAENNDCSNHPGVEAVTTIDGAGLHSPQKFCEECIQRRGEN